MTHVTFTIKGMRSNGSASRKTLPFAKVKGNEITIKSQLGNDSSLNDHLVWLWGMLQGERRFLRSLQADGGVISIHAVTNRLPTMIEANGAEMVHLLGATLTIDRG